MQIVESFLTQNPCYKANVERADARYRKFQDEGPKGLMLHLSSAIFIPPQILILISCFSYHHFLLMILTGQIQL